MGTGAVGARAALSRRHGQAQRERRRDPEALRRRDLGRGDRRRSRTRLLDDRTRTRRARLSRYGRRASLDRMDMSVVAPAIGPPLWLLAELTYRCPLHCVFCYNPVDFAKHEDELATADWIRVLREARAIGAVQC